MLSPQIHTNTIKTFLRTKSARTLRLFVVALISFAPLVWSLEPLSAATGINDQISFQGKVVNTNGTNVSNGNYDFVFKLYTIDSGGAAVWTETWNSGTAQVTVTDGIFQVNLGTHTDLPGSIDFNTDNVYLGIEFNGDGEMTPRVHFTAAPYAFNALKVAGLTVTDTTGTLTIPNAETISFGGSFTTSASNDVTLTTSGATTVTLPTTGTLATLAGSEVFTNKTIGSTGLTFSGATTDITTASGESLVLTAAGAGTIDLQDATTADSLTLDSGGLTLQNGETIGNGTDDIIAFAGAGGGDNTDLFLDLDGTSPVLSSNADIRISVEDYLNVQVSGVTSAAAGDIWYDSAANKFKINENGTTKIVCNTTDLGCGSGATTWDTIGDAAGNGAIAMAETVQTLDWNTGDVTALAFDGLTVSITNDAATDVLTQRAFVVANLNDAGATGTTETIVQIDNRDANETVGTGLLVENTGAGTMTNAIQIAETAGTITDGILITGTLGNILNSASLDITGAGAITGATGVSTTTVTASSTIDAQGDVSDSTGNLTLNDAVDISGALAVSGTSLTATSATTITLGSTGADTITLGNGGADTITIGNAASTGVSIIDNNWSVTTAGVATFITGTVIGSQTFTTNNIADSGALTIASGSAADLTFNSGTTGAINIGTDTSAETISLGTGVAAKTITIGNASDDTFSINSSGLNVSSGGTLTGVASIDTIATSATALTFAGTGTVSSTTSSALTLDSGTTGTVNLGTGNNAKTIAIGTGTAGNTINIGTDNTTSDTINIGSALDNVAITGDQWSVTNAGVLTVVSCSGCGGGGTTWNSIGAPTGALSLTFDAGETSTFAMTGLTTETGFALSSDAGFTSGELMDLTVSAASGFTGQLVDLNLSNVTGASSNTGTLLKLTNSGTANANTSLVIQHNATGTGNLAMRVNDVASDTTPFIIDGAGFVGIGTTAIPNQLTVVSAEATDPAMLVSACDTCTTSLVLMNNIAAVNSKVGLDLQFSAGTYAEIFAIRESGVDGSIGFSTNLAGSVGERMRLEYTGELGIGDTSPDNPLEILSTSQQLRLSYTDGSVDGLIYVDSNEYLTFQAGTSSETDRVQIGAGGAGSTTPDFFGLDVKSDTGDPAGGFEGAMYYNTFDNVFRCYQDSGWTNCIGTGGAGGETLQQTYAADADSSNATISLTAADDSLVFTNPTSAGTDSAFVLQVSQQNTTAAVAVLDLVQSSNAANGVNLTANSIDTETGLAITANGLTSGTGFTVASSSTAFTGSLAGVTLSGSDAANTGSVFQVANTGTLNTNTALYVQHYATGTNNLAVRVDDVSGDTSPFVINGAGQVGVGTTSPARAVDIFESASAPQLRLSKDLTNYSEFTVDSTGDLQLAATGTDIRALSENLWVCDGDACPALTLTGDGNIFVENVVKFGNGVYFKNDSATELGVYDNDDNAMLIFDEQ